MENNQIRCRCPYFDGTCHHCGQQPQSSNVPQSENKQDNPKVERSAEVSDIYQKAHDLATSYAQPDPDCPEDYNSNDMRVAYNGYVKGYTEAAGELEPLHQRIAELEALNDKYKALLTRWNHLNDTQDFYLAGPTLRTDTCQALNSKS